MQTINVPHEKIVRIPAMYVQGRGHLGCIGSHYNAILTFLHSSHTMCMIFEDDFTIKDPSTFWSSIHTFLQEFPSFDVCMLSHNIKKSTPTHTTSVVRVQSSYTSAGYILHRNFAERLLNHFKDCLQKAIDEEERTHRKTHHYCLDVYWEVLMNDPTVRWYAIEPSLGYQKPSFSDIENCYVDHKV